jgi:ABC-type lipopolysaccharide export system ATPase subunit
MVIVHHNNNNNLFTLRKNYHLFMHVTFAHGAELQSESSEQLKEEWLGKNFAP